MLCRKDGKQITAVICQCLLNSQLNLQTHKLCHSLCQLKHHTWEFTKSNSNSWKLKVGTLGASITISIKNSISKTIFICSQLSSLTNCFIRKTSLTIQQRSSITQFSVNDGQNWDLARKLRTNRSHPSLWWTRLSGEKVNKQNCWSCYSVHLVHHQ